MVHGRKWNMDLQIFVLRAECWWGATQKFDRGTIENGMRMRLEINIRRGDLDGAENKGGHGKRSQRPLKYADAIGKRCVGKGQLC